MGAYRPFVRFRWLCGLEESGSLYAINILIKYAPYNLLTFQRLAVLAITYHIPRAGKSYH